VLHIIVTKIYMTSFVRSECKLERGKIFGQFYFSDSSLNSGGKLLEMNDEAFFKGQKDEKLP
jgi:hypothetical protein